jgi:hypothetical protein
MKEAIKAKVEGVELILLDREIAGANGDLWVPRFDWDGPSAPASISEWKERISAWRIAKQIEAGFEVWNLSDDRPKYWEKRPAVFREGKEDQAFWDQPRKVLTRNGAYDPDSLYGIELGSCAMDTPEVVEAIEAARKLHEEAVKAAKRFKDAVKAIPRMTKDDWLTLPPKPGSDQ